MSITTDHLSEDSIQPPVDRKLGCRAWILIIFWFLTAMFLVVVFWVWTSFSAVPQTGQPLFEPNVAANHVTGPLDANGDVDYEKHVRRDSGRGVSRENNAMVGLVAAIGHLPTESTEQFFIELDIDTPKPENRRLGFSAWRESTGCASDELGQKFSEQYFEEREAYLEYYGLEHPFNKQDSPELVAYVKSQQARIELIYQAVAMPDFYYPKISGSDESGLLGVLLPHIQEFRALARLLQMRSNFRIGAGDLLGATEDASVIVRLSDRVSQGDTMVELLVAIAIRGIGLNQLNQIVGHPDIELADLKRCRALLASYKPFDRCIFLFSNRERLLVLDFCQRLFRNGASSQILDGLSAGSIQTVWPKISDPESAMISINQFFDEVTALLNQAKADPKLDPEALVDEAIYPLIQPLSLGKKLALVFSSRKQRGRMLGRNLVSVLCSTVGTVINAENRSNSSLELFRLTVELEIYHRQHGQYPETLNALVPDQIAKLPVDRFAGGGDYVYRRVEEKYVLYSMGANRTDDGGPSSEAEPLVGGDWWLECQPPLTWQQYIEKEFPDDPESNPLLK